MKRIIVTLLLLAGSLASLHAQTAKQEPWPYQKNPGLPAIPLLLVDSSTIYNTFYAKEGRPSVLFFFSPDCEHCHATTQAMLSKWDSLKDANFYFMTPLSLYYLKVFIHQYHLTDYKNIIAIGKDFQYMFPQYYGARTVPYIVVYDKHKQFVRLWEGGVKTTTLIHVLDSLK